MLLPFSLLSHTSILDKLHIVSNGSSCVILRCQPNNLEKRRKIDRAQDSSSHMREDAIKLSN